MGSPRTSGPAVSQQDSPLDLSLVVPIYNELENVVRLHQTIRAALDPTEEKYEVIYVDDGSTDGSGQRLDALAADDPLVRVIHLRRNFGQSAAMDAGISHASGEFVVTLDGDLQNDPADIPMMVARAREGYDLVHGWRKNRQDTYFSRKIPSRIANWLISRVTRVPVHDLGCTLKVVRREIAQELRLQGEMHRFMTILAYARGARTLEVVTRHHPRRFGISKYGISRTFRVLLDLLTVKYLLDYAANPIRLFGSLGVGCGVIGGMAGLATVAMRVFQGVDMTGNPLLLLTVFSGMAALQLVSLGLLGEVANRAYHESRGLRTYAIRSRVNFPPSWNETSSSSATTTLEASARSKAA